MKINSQIMDLVRSKKTQLPTLPVIIENILRFAGSNTTSAKDLSEYIRKDQSISNKILKLANSAYYGLVREVDTIPRAITIVGFNEVIGLTIGMSVFSAFGPCEDCKMLNMKDLWIHAIGCAISAREVANRTDKGVGEQIYLSGLLHDMGKVLFSVYFPKEYETVLEKAMESKTPLNDIENDMLGIDHATLSGLLMERWHFPDSLMLPSRYHHNLSACPSDYKNYAMIINVADFLCRKANIGHSGNHFSPSLEKFSSNHGICTGEMEIIMKELNSQRSKIEEFFHLIA
jgi:HD-like signal output (HDOD) protein